MRIIYSTINPGDYRENYAIVDPAPLGKLLKEMMGRMPNKENKG